MNIALFLNALHNSETPTDISMNAFAASISAAMGLAPGSLKSALTLGLQEIYIAQWMIDITLMIMGFLSAIRAA